MKTIAVWSRKGGQGKTLWSHLLCWRMMQHQPTSLVLYCCHDKQEDGLDKALQRKIPLVRGVLYGTLWWWHAVWGIEEVWERVREIPYDLLVFDLPPATEELKLFSRLKLRPDLWLLPVHSLDAWNTTYSAKPFLETLGGERYWLPTGTLPEVARDMEETLLWKQEKVLSPIPKSELLGTQVPHQCVPPGDIAPSSLEVQLAMRACDKVLGALFPLHKLLAPLSIPSLVSTRAKKK